MTLFEIIILLSVVITSIVLIYLVYSVHTLQDQSIYLHQLGEHNLESGKKATENIIEAYKKMTKLTDSLLRSKETEKMLLDMADKHQNDINDINGILQEILCEAKK